MRHRKLSYNNRAHKGTHQPQKKAHRADKLEMLNLFTRCGEQKALPKNYFCGGKKLRKTKVLLVGSGAREHAIADALIAGGAELYAYMQLLNPGIKKIAKTFTVGKADDVAV